MQGGQLAFVPWEGTDAKEVPPHPRPLRLLRVTAERPPSPSCFKQGPNSFKTDFQTQGLEKVSFWSTAQVPHPRRKQDAEEMPSWWGSLGAECVRVVCVRVVCVEGKPRCSQSLPGPAQTCPGFRDARLGSGAGDSPQKYVNFLIS